MKIIEVRDGFIKFEADSSIYLSLFIQVDGMDKSYIAQVNQLKHIGNITIASAKILFLFNGNELFNYDRTEPSVDSEIKPFPLDILLSSIKLSEPIIIGKTLNKENNITIDFSAFNKKMLISIDNTDINNTLIQNLSKQFENLNMKSVVIDTLGIIKSPKYTAGVDFKLPLNTSTLDFIYKSCLNDATEESKSSIVEIFQELSEYSKTVPFVPFQTLKSIVDEMVDKQHIFKLLVLKNKLAKFEKLGYFAATQNEIPDFEKLFEQYCSVIDISFIEPVFQNKYLSFIYETLASFDNTQVFFIVSNTISKQNLKNILSSNISTTFITHSKFQYLNDIKNLFDNFIITPSISNNEIFKVYSTFLTSMDRNTYLMAGEALNYIPFVSEIQVIDEAATPVLTAELDKSDKNELLEDILTDETTDEEPIQDYLDTEESENKEDAVIENFDIEDSDTEADYENDIQIIDDNVEEDYNSNKESTLLPPIGDHSIPEEEILSKIEENSQNAINEVASNIGSTSDIDLFPEEEDEDNENFIENSEEQPVIDIQEEAEQSISDEEFEQYNENEQTDSYDDDKIEELSYETEDEFDNPELNILTDNDGDELDFISEDGINTDNEFISDISEEESVQAIEDSNENTEQNDIINTNSELETDTEDLVISGDAEEILDTLEPEDILNSTQSTTEDITLSDSSMDIDLSEQSIIPLEKDDSSDVFDEIVELDQDIVNENDIIVDINEEETTNISENVEQQIKEDVDKVYTTIKEDSDLEEISDSDLDLIDELNNDEEELEEYNGEELQEISDADFDNDMLEEFISGDSNSNLQNDSSEILEKRDSTTPIVPVYDANIPQEDMVVSDPIQQGDAVVHAKYGNGVVEKMIKYGNKTLYAINFENIGRRLLDPTLTELKRV